MSAAAARRRKQLAARKAAADQDVVGSQLNKILFERPDDKPMDEADAYEALQLAQSQIRKKEHAGQFSVATDLAARCCLVLLKKGRVSVASQLLTLLVEVLRETHTEESDEWIARIVELQDTHASAMKSYPAGVETTRLQRLQRDWLRQCVNWSSELGKFKFGTNKLQELLGHQCWTLATMEEDEEEVMELHCDAVQHMALAEKPDQILEWLKTFPKPTAEQTRSGHVCPPAVRDALLSRSLLLFCAVENLRDANILLRAYIDQVEERDIKELAVSYTKKEDGKAPSHAIFGCMLLRICEKDTRTGPLYSWLLRSFKRELDRFYKPQVVLGYTSKIGTMYFNIQPPPNMLNMMENMMSMMGGGGGAPGGMNPAMMQAALAQMQQGGMM